MAIFPPVLRLYREREEEGFVSGPITLDESISIITKLSGYYAQMTIIIDALDECQLKKRIELLEALEQILQRSLGMVKLFISSRNDHDIVCHLQNYPELSISSSRNRRDIESFIKAETEALIKKGRLLRYCSDKVTLENEIIQKLCKGATGK